MAVANFAALIIVFGEEAASRIKSCEFHFKDQRNKKAQRLDNENSGRFKELCNLLLTSETEDGYAKSKAAMDAFIEESEDYAFLKTWVSWWHDRRGFICRAFAPKDAPEMNKAEVIHAGWTHRDSPNLSLLDVYHVDVRDTLVLEKQLESYKEGIPAPGNGPSFAERKRRQHARQLQKAKRIGKEMFEDSENGHVIDPSSSYQPPRNKKRKGKQSGGNQSKGKVTVNSGPVAYGDTPNMAPPNMPLSNVCPQNVPSCFMSPQNALPSFSSTPNTFPSSLPLHNAPESNVPQAYVPPSNVPPPISVPSNNSGPYWQQAFQSTFPCFTHWPSLPAVNAPQSNPYPPSSATPHYGNQWHSGLSPNPYEIVLLPSNVQKCYGCGAAFAEKSRSAPYNLCIKHVDKRLIGKNADGRLVYSTDFTNTYYHPSISHIKRKNSLFTGQVYIGRELFRLVF